MTKDDEDTLGEGVWSFCEDRWSGGGVRWSTIVETMIYLKSCYSK